MLRLLALLLLLTPAAASASTVSVHKDNGSFSSLTYDAGAGEPNSLTVTYSEITRIATVVDPGATITPGERCETVDIHQVKCTAFDDDGAFWKTIVNLGDGIDSAVQEGSTLPNLIAHGGPGDDTLSAPSTSSGGNVLDGGPGADHLLATEGSALLVEGDPDSDPQPDVLEVGEYQSGTVSYKGRTEGVTIDLENGTGGVEGENDVLKGVEGANGGAGDDTLISGKSTYTLTGGGGDDTFVNTGGADSAMTWYGNKGTDVYKCRAKSAEDISGPEFGELIGPDCTTISNGDWTDPPTAASHTATSVTFKLECPTNNAADFRHRDCVAKVTLTDPKSGKFLGTGAFSQPKGENRKETVVIALNALGQKLLRKKRAVDVTMKAKRYETLTWTTRLSDTN